MTRKSNSYRYHHYIGKEKCPVCGLEGYIEEGRMMGQIILKTMHKLYEPVVQYARTVKVCYGETGFSTP